MGARLGGVTRRERIEEVVRDVLAPLLEKDGGGIALVSFEGSVVKLRIAGTLLGDPGTNYVKRSVIEPAVKAAAGPDVEIVYERAVE